MKRKELEGVNDDDHFSISSSPIKILRHDAEFSPAVPESNIFPQAREEGHVGSDVINELADNNEEKAIVLFNPVNYNTTLFLESPSTFSVDSQFLSGLKNQILLANQSKYTENFRGKAERQEKDFDGCLAVVPWVPSQLPTTQVAEVQQPDASEMIDTEDMELASMDTEDYDIGIEQRARTKFGGTSVNDGLHHWQQEQCIVPQVPQSTSTPLVWFG